MTEGTSSVPYTLTVAEDVLWQSVGDQVIVLDLQAGLYHELDSVGSRMWEALHECADVAAARARLRDIYDVDPDTLAADLDAFVRELVDMGLLTVTAR